MADFKAVVGDELDKKADWLKELSAEIWRFAELGYEEFKSHSTLVQALEKEGFVVEKEVAGLKTAFRATFGSGRPNVAFICEYDALPEIGHACGHNLIAKAGLGAGLGLKRVLEDCKDSLSGTVTIFGTPAEESGGGKVKMIEGGCFSDADVAMMVHPTGFTALEPLVLSTKRFEITFIGKESHAAMCPWEGVNALDAAVMAYSSISVLRQQLKPDWRVHGIIVNGGAKPNIIPGKTVMLYQMRAKNDDELAILTEKVLACFKSAALATGCTLKIENYGVPYSNMTTNPEMATTFASYCNSLGFPMKDSPEATAPMGSTDMGNVSHVVPSIHPCYAIGTAVNHTREFTTVTNTPPAYEATLIMAKAMALTGVDILTNKDLLPKIQESFKKQHGK
jgi:amidohydrolase